MTTTASKEIIGVNLEDEMRGSYLDYSMSVIVGRALPDARDGLKPVHRRILYAMYQEGLLSSKRYSKCAGVVGEVLKKYHPHGDNAVYDALVRMAQAWNMSTPLIDGQGNFGSIDGDSAAAYRYTECRMTKVAEMLMQDIEKETVLFRPNYDDSTVEPRVLPTRIPNLLVNGSDGIAVGMATKIPPHNLGEVVNALIYLIDNPQAELIDLLLHIPGPDFPTGAHLLGRGGIHQAYKTGRGKVMMRAVTNIEPMDKSGDREAIIVTEIPYQVNKARVIEHIAELVGDGKLEGISDIRDESDRQGMRIVIELKRGIVASVVLNQLHTHTALQSSFGIIMLAIVKGVPKVLSLREALDIFLEHRRDVVIRRTSFELNQALARAHILEGLKIAVENIDAVITLIRESASPPIAKMALRESFSLSEIQAQAILDMRLQKLTGLECDKIILEHKEILLLIGDLRAILDSPSRLLSIIKQELLEVKSGVVSSRRTQILDQEFETIDDEDLIEQKEMVITVSHMGYIKRQPIETYRAQRRGGKGKQGMMTRDEDFVETIFGASTHDHLLVFTSFGKVHWIRVFAVPEASRIAKGKAINNFVPLQTDEKVATILPVKKFTDDEFVFFTTKKGTVKKTALSAYANQRANGILAILLENDELISAKLVKVGQHIILSTSSGQAIRFAESDVRSMGRQATGVRGISLDEHDSVVGCDIATENTAILTVSEKGYGKRTPLEEYRCQNRGGGGTITLKITDKTGCVITATQVYDSDDLMLVTNGGKIIRQNVKAISLMGRNTQGVRLIDLDEGEVVVSATRIEPESDEQEVSPV